ncbi:MAG: DUF2877 domain-containing protein [Actinomycetota bacterium]
MISAATARVTVVPVAASDALRPSLAGVPRAGTVLGAGERTAWARLGNEVLVIQAAGGVRMPNGVELPSSAASLLGSLSGDEAFFVEEYGLGLGDWSLRVGNWWEPRPVLPRADRAALREEVAAVRDGFAPVDDQGLGAALADGDPQAVTAVGQCLIGNGPGLTPLGDDVLAGALAAALLLGKAVGSRRLYRVVAGVAPPLCALARDRTTALAATLLRHACRGEVDDASAALLRALCGRGDPGTALDRVLAVGHSSGTGLATGILAAAACAGGAP